MSTAYTATCFGALALAIGWLHQHEPAPHVETALPALPALPAAPMSAVVPFDAAGIADGISYEVTASYHTRFLGPAEGPERVRTESAPGNVFFVVELEVAYLGARDDLAISMAGAGRLAHGTERVIASRRALEALVRGDDVGAENGHRVLHSGERVHVTVAFEVPTYWATDEIVLEIPQRAAPGYEALRLLVKAKGP